MDWNEREGNQRKKIVKNGTRWGQILCSVKKTLLFYWMSYVCMSLRKFTASMEEEIIFVYDFLKITYFGFFPLGSISIKACKFERASKLDESNFKGSLSLQTTRINHSECHFNHWPVLLPKSYSSALLGWLCVHLDPQHRVVLLFARVKIGCATPTNKKLNCIGQLQRVYSRIPLWVSFHHIVYAKVS